MSVPPAVQQWPHFELASSCWAAAHRRGALIVVLWLACVTLAWSCACRGEHLAEDLTGPRRLLAEMQLDPQVDEALFRKHGFDESAAMLHQLVDHGDAELATPDEWLELHQALEGLIELSTLRSEFLKAAVYANMQDFHYRNKEGDFAQALRAARQQLELQQRSGQLATLYVPWKNIGENLIHLGRVDEALAALYQARELIQEPTTSISAIIWRAIIDGELERDNPAAARAASSAFLEAADRQSPALFRGRALLGRGRVEGHHAQYDAALDSIHAALHVLNGGSDQLRLQYEAANDLLSLVLMAVTTLPYDTALALATRIDREFTDLPISLSREARRAIQYRRRLAGDFDAVLREQHAAVEQMSRSGNVSSRIESLTALAATYGAVNDKRSARVVLDDALHLQDQQLARTPDDIVALQSRYRLLITLASLNVELGDAGAARQLVANLAHVQVPGNAKSQISFEALASETELVRGLIAHLEHNYGEARAIFRHLLAAPPMPAQGQHRSVLLLKAAQLEQESNTPPSQAVAYYEEAIVALRKSGDVHDEIAARLRLVDYLVGDGWLVVADARGRATEHLRLVEAAASSIAFADARWRSQFLRGALAEREGRSADAIADYERAASTVEALRAELSQPGQRQSFVDTNDIQRLYRRLTSVLTATGQKGKAWEYVEKAKARSFLDLLQGRRMRNPEPTGSDQEVQRLEREISDLEVRLSGFRDARRESGWQGDVLRSKLSASRARFVLARRALVFTHNRGSQELAVAPPPMEEVQARLAPDTALIEYAILDGKLCVFIVTRERVVQAVWAADLHELRARVAVARDLLADPLSLAELQPTLRFLSSRIFAPVLPLLPAQTRRLVIVAADFLHYLPFDVLPLPEGGDVIDRFAVSYLPSASTLAFLDSAELPRNRNVFLGAIGRISVDGMAPLPGTIAEVRSVASMYREPQVAIESAFTRDRVRRALMESSIVHIATHGILNAEAPLFSAILTSPAARQPSRLSLYQLTDVRLKPGLVILSACETALGELSRGDEITSLSRVLLQAGAQAVISSLWTVSDQSTAVLMSTLHRRLQAGDSVADALRRAALTVRKAKPHPYYWAPFIVSGSG